MSEIPMYPDQCEHGASRPDLCGHCQLATVVKERDCYRRALEDIRDDATILLTDPMWTHDARVLGIQVVADNALNAYVVVAQDVKPLRPRT